VSTTSRKPLSLLNLSPPEGALAALLLGLLGTLGAGFWAYSYDDAHITYRYADHLANTGRLEYSPGERVLGTTAPGWALALAALAKISFGGIDVPAWGTILSLVALGTLVLTLASALRRAPPPYRLGLPFLFGLLTPTLRWNLEMIGAETMAVTALVPLGVLLALRGRGAAGGVLLAAATLCRLDAALAAGVLLPVLLLRDRPAARRFALSFGLPVALFVGGLLLHFGAVVPNTLAAKQAEQTADLPTYGLRQWRWWVRTLPAPGAAALVLALAGVAAATAVKGCRARGVLAAAPEPVAAAVLATWLVAHEVAYRVLAVPFAPWYHLPAVNALVALAIAGALRVGTLCALPAPEGLRPRLGFAVAAALLLGLFQPWSYLANQWRRAPDPRYDAFRRVGEHLDRTAAPGATVAALEIGILGTFAPSQRILDLGGLVSPAVLAARSDGTLPAFLATTRPDYLIDSTHFAAFFAPILARPEIATGYHEVLRIPDGRGAELRVLARDRTPAPRATGRQPGGAIGKAHP
jgi:hypothetical protein